MRFRALFLLCLLAPVLAQAQLYHLRQLPDPENNQCAAEWINDSSSVFLVCPRYKYLLHVDGSLVPATFPNDIIALNVYQQKMSEYGEFVMTGATSNFLRVALRFNPTTDSQRVNVLPGSLESSPTSLNNRGDVVGWCTPNGIDTAIWTHADGTVEDLGRKAGYGFFTPLDINDEGVIVGSSGGFNNDGTVALKWTRQKGFEDIEKFPTALAQEGRLVSNDGTIIVGVVPNDFKTRLGVIEPDGTRTLINGPEAGFAPIGVDLQGNVGGLWSTTGYSGKAIFWKRGWPRGRWMEDLVDLSVQGWHLVGASAPNNKGQIVCAGNFNGSRLNKPVLLTPNSYNYPPFESSLKIGKLDHGSVSSLALADGDSLSIQRFLVPTLVSPAVSFVISSHLPIDTMWAWLKLRARATGSATMKVSLWDNQSKAWDSKYPLSMDLSPEWSTGECIAKKRMERLLDETSTIKARIQVYPTSLDPNFLVDIDQASFEAVPESG